MMHRHNSATQRAQQLQALTEQQQQQFAHLQQLQQQQAFGDFQNFASGIDPSLQHAYQLSPNGMVQPASAESMSRSRTSPRSVQPHTVQRPAPIPSRHSDVAPSKRPRSMPAPQGLSMSRSISEGTPFTGSSRVTPLPRARNTPTQGAPAFGGMNYLGGTQTSNSFSLISQNRYRQGMPALPETGPTGESTLLDPEAYLATLPGVDEPVMDFGSSFTSQPFDDASFAMQFGSMTSQPTYITDTAPMTRENSLFDRQSITGAVDMMQIGSQMSHLSAQSYPTTQSSDDDASPLAKKKYLMGNSINMHGSDSALPSVMQYPDSTDLDAAQMERSVSESSNKSASSQNVRAKETLREQNGRAKITLAPKPLDERADRTSSKKDGKASIPKTKYVRPRQPRVYCDECADHPEGFRGDHELRRHRDAKHQTLVKKWICVDPISLGLPPGVAVVNPLSKCKACKANKKYGAYYNAAAHLRRTHFKEKPSRQKNKRNSTSEDRRGGKGGGDWPSMSELKNWMQEVWVNARDEGCEPEEDGDEDNSQQLQPAHGDFNGGVDYNSFQMPAHDMSALQMGSNDFNHGLTISPVGYNANASHQMASSYSPDFGAYAAQGMMGQPQYIAGSMPANVNMAVHAGMNDFTVDELPFEMVYPQ